jgi:hypothetical protein
LAHFAGATLIASPLTGWPCSRRCVGETTGASAICLAGAYTAACSRPTAPSPSPPAISTKPWRCSCARTGRAATPRAPPTRPARLRAHRALPQGRGQRPQACLA